MKAKFNYMGSAFLANIYLLKVKNRNTRKRCEICSKLTIVHFEQVNASFNFNLIFIFEMKFLTQIKNAFQKVVLK